ncbi:MAG TPA: tRNA (cytidine(34)-2'-O)-methyltransferase [Terriglobales bacterium]|nr:tRNA (cytidine(34)-2'-O)-methyltransferase [Terriglobales bacterium]
MPTESDPPLHVVLVHPEIPPNTGSIARLCAATGIRLHLIEPLGFSLDDRYLKRAGLDYWPHVDLRVHPNWQAYCAANAGARRLLFSARAERSYVEAEIRRGDHLVFGCETKGLPAAVLAEHGEHVYVIPIFTAHVRSLNLSNAVSIAAYEGLRQLGCLSGDAGAC